MGRLGAVSMIEEAGVDVALRWHLGSNMYPPIPSYMFEPCKDAIEAANAGDWERTIKLPHPVYKGNKDKCPASALIESARLEAFIEENY